MATIYMLRGQGLGVLHEKAYAAFPPEEAIREALALELERHGLKDGKPCERWVAVIEVELDENEASPNTIAGPCAFKGILDVADVRRMNKAGPPASRSAAGDIVTRGTGIIINPE